MIGDDVLMPNYCDFTMKIVGKKTDCRTFISKFSPNNKITNHFWRVFEVDIYNEETHDNQTSLYIYGQCAWSLESCCRASGYSNGTDLFEVNTKKLNLKMEAYSSEYGIGFEEHYIYNHGVCEACECIDATEYFWDRTEFPTYQEFKEEYPDAPPEEKFEGEDPVIVGGFGERYAIWTI